MAGNPAERERQAAKANPIIPQDSILYWQISRGKFIAGIFVTVTGLSLSGPACANSRSSQASNRESPVASETSLQIVWERPFARQTYFDAENNSIYLAWYAPAESQSVSLNLGQNSANPMGNLAASNRIQGGIISKLNPDNGQAKWDYPWRLTSSESSILARHGNALIVRSDRDIYTINDQNGQFVNRSSSFYDNPKVESAVFLLANGNVLVVDDRETYLVTIDDGIRLKKILSKNKQSIAKFYSDLEEISRRGRLPVGMTHLPIATKSGGGFLNVRDLDVFIPDNLNGQLPFKVVDGIALFTALDEKAGKTRGIKISGVDLTTGKERWYVPGYSFNPIDGAQFLSENRMAVLARNDQSHRYAAVDVKTGEIIWQREEDDRRLGLDNDGGYLYATNGTSASRGGLFTPRETSPATDVKRIDTNTGKNQWTVRLDGNDYSERNNQIRVNLDPDSQFGKMLYRPFWAAADFMILANADSVCIVNARDGQVLHQTRLANRQTFTAFEQTDLRENIVANGDFVFLPLKDKLYVLNRQTRQLRLEKQFDATIKNLEIAGSSLLVREGDTLHCLR